MSVIKRMENSLVSIYIPTFNRYKLLERAVNSVLSQTYNQIELIIVDNGSTDRTVEYLKSLELINNIKVIYLKENLGACYARNRAIEISTGEYITGLDDDDYFTKDRISSFITKYHIHGKPVFSEDKLIINEGKSKIIKKNLVIKYKDLFRFNYIGNQLFTKKQDYVLAGMFDENLEAGQDYDMWLKILKLRGEAFNTGLVTQMMDTSYCGERISMSPLKKRGYFKLYKKYKSEFSVNNRKLHLLRIKYQTSAGISFSVFRKLFFFGEFRYILVIFIRSVLLKKKISM